ncbi:hypothetical protein ACK3VO_05180, partial [Klebsiella pneumoniae]|uniref:hypothetical protein n=1 Tax=Klebsiella pneumoniae TaxID=573 RepID=UPI003919B6C5
SVGEISVKTGNNARNGGKNSLNRLIRCVCGKKIGPDPRNFNQRVSLGRNDLLIRTFHSNSNILIGLIRCFYERLMLLTIFAARLICINLEFDIVFPVIKSFEFWS